MQRHRSAGRPKHGRGRWDDRGRVHRLVFGQERQHAAGDAACGHVRAGGQKGAVGRIGEVAHLQNRRRRGDGDGVPVAAAECVVAAHVVRHSVQVLPHPGDRAVVFAQQGAQTSGRRGGPPRRGDLVAGAAAPVGVDRHEGVGVELRGHGGREQHHLDALFAQQLGCCRRHGPVDVDFRHAGEAGAGRRAPMLQLGRVLVGVQVPDLQGDAPGSYHSPQRQPRVVGARRGAQRNEPLRRGGFFLDGQGDGGRRHRGDCRGDQEAYEHGHPLPLYRHTPGVPL